jgi:ssDNA-binding Zn-finger/Zn-ribbon topoisomerase 1
MIDQGELIAAHIFCDNHRGDLQGQCGCFYCQQTFPASEITEWIDGEQSALCPKCGIDSVLPSTKTRIDAEFLEAMYDKWFRIA